jgi:hypothetical protein
MHYAMVFDTKEEFDEVAALVAAKRRQPGIAPESEVSARAQKLEAALAMSPLNAQKATVLRTWLAAPDGEWLPYAAVVKAFVDAGIAAEEQASGRASAALRDLSWQVAQTLPRSDLAQFDKAIEALASRSRAGGAFSYRLTPAGRLATERFLKNVEAV